jgi:hypothetical protein
LREIVPDSIDAGVCSRPQTNQVVIAADESTAEQEIETDPETV